MNWRKCVLYIRNGCLRLSVEKRYISSLHSYWCVVLCAECTSDRVESNRFGMECPISIRRMRWLSDEHLMAYVNIGWRWRVICSSPKIQKKRETIQLYLQNETIFGRTPVMIFRPRTRAWTRPRWLVRSRYSSCRFIFLFRWIFLNKWLIKWVCNGLIKFKFIYFYLYISK